VLNRKPLAVRGEMIKGFTLLELIVTISVISIIAMMAAPSFMTQIRKNQLYSEMRQLVENAMETRSEAVFRRVNQRMVMSGVDATAFKQWSAEKSQFVVAPQPLEYNLMGFLEGDAQCIELEHTADNSITLAITFNKNGSVISGKDKISCN
jgi:type IV fimbrial biogenesis protein FimT